MVSRSTSPLKGACDYLSHPLVQCWTSVLLGCYAGALLVASPICGWFADRSQSRRLPFVLGLLALGGSTVFLYVGSPLSLLILGRIFEGISGAVMWTSGLGLLVDSVGQMEIGKIMGYCSLSIESAILLGPFLGGIILARRGYHAVFAMTFGLIFFDVLLRLAVVEKKVAAKWNTVVEQRDETDQISLYNDKRALMATGTYSPSENQHGIPTIKSTLFHPVHSLPPVITLLRSRRLLVAL